MSFVVFDLIGRSTWADEIARAINQWNEEPHTPVDIRLYTTPNRPESWIMIRANTRSSNAGETYHCDPGEVPNNCTQEGVPRNIHESVIDINPNRVDDSAAYGSKSEFLESVLIHELGHALGLKHAGYDALSGGRQTDGEMCSTRSVMTPPYYATRQGSTPETDTWLQDIRHDDIGKYTPCPTYASANLSLSCIYQIKGWGSEDRGNCADYQDKDV